jgi:hypothetical protein
MKKTIAVIDLPQGYSMFGNKGTVWEDKAHACKDGVSTTLCGLPMLSTNWARIEGLSHIGCPDCIKIIEALPQPDRVSGVEFWVKMFRPRTTRWQRATLRRLRADKSAFETSEEREDKIKALVKLKDE